MKKYWMSGTYWFTEEACQAQCKVIHARLGQKEAPTPIYLAADVEQVLRDNTHLRAVLQLCVDAWKHEGEPSAIGYEAAIDQATRLLERLR